MKYVNFILVLVLVYLIYQSRKNQSFLAANGGGGIDPKNLNYAVPPSPAQQRSYAMNHYGYLK